MEEDARLSPGLGGIPTPAGTLHLAVLKALPQSQMGKLQRKKGEVFSLEDPVLSPAFILVSQACGHFEDDS